MNGGTGHVALRLCLAPTLRDIFLRLPDRIQRRDRMPHGTRKVRCHRDGIDLFPETGAEARGCAGRVRRPEVRFCGRLWRRIVHEVGLRDARDDARFPWLVSAWLQGPTGCTSHAPVCGFLRSNLTTDPSLRLRTWPASKGPLVTMAVFAGAVVDVSAG